MLLRLLTLEEFTEMFNKLRDSRRPYKLHYSEMGNGRLMIWVPAPSNISQRFSWQRFDCAKYFLFKRKVSLTFIKEYFNLRQVRETMKTKVFVDNKQRVITIYCNWANEYSFRGST